MRRGPWVSSLTRQPRGCGRRRSSRCRAAPRSPSAANSPTISPLVDDEDPVRERQDLLELERDEQDAAALVALGDEPPVDELDRADVEPARRLRGDQHARVAVDLAREDDLLLVAAREAAGARLRRRRRGRRTPSRAGVARSTSRRGNSQPSARVRRLAEVVQRDVLGDRELEHEPAALAVLRDVAEARRR